MEKVDEHTKAVILDALLERNAPEKVFYPVGRVRFRYWKQPQNVPNKELLVEDFGLEAVVGIASITNKNLERFLHDQGVLPPNYIKYLVEGKKYDVLDTPEIQPTLEKERVLEIMDILIKQAITTNKKS